MDIFGAIANDDQMKFVYFGYDFMLPSVKRLIADGHELLGLCTFQCDNVFNFNRETINLAQDMSLPIIAIRPGSVHIDKFLKDGAECFLSAGYPFKVPPIPDEKVYGLNFHPSLLPRGRGIMPSPHIIMDHPEASGMSVHKLTPVFDDGDILYQEALPVHERETVETLSARIAMRAPDILSMVMADLPRYWAEAKPQDKNQASYFSMPDDEMRFLEWRFPVRDLDKIGRAFGRYGSLAKFDDALWVVYAHDVWEEAHDHDPGTVVARSGREIVVAARDGFVCLKDFQKAPAHK